MERLLGLTWTGWARPGRSAMGASAHARVAPPRRPGRGKEHACAALHATRVARRTGQLVQGHVGVAQALDVDGGGVAHERPGWRSLTSHTLTFIPASTRPSRSQKAMNSRVAGSPRKTTSSPGRAVARVLHPDVVLVGEEVRHALVGRRPGRAWRARPPGPAPGRWPSARRAGARTAGARGWRRRRPRRRRRRSRAARRRRGSRCRPRSTPSASAVRGATPTPSRTAAHSRTAPSLGAHALGATRALDGLDARAQVQLDAVLGVHVAIEGAELAAEHALQRHRLRLHQGHLHAALARRGGDLAADPARRRRPRAARRRRARRAARRSPPPCAGRGRRRGRRPGSAGAWAPRRWRAAARRSRMRSPPASTTARAPTSSDSTTVAVRSSTVVLLVPAGVLLQVDSVAIGLAAQVVLAQRRALVGPLGLGAQQDDAAVEPSSRSASTALPPAMPAPTMTKV